MDPSSYGLVRRSADGEVLGFLEKPHASSGRVPTASGYRLYVETLLRVRQPPAADRERIEKLALVKVALFTLLTVLAALVLTRQGEHFSWARVAAAGVSAVTASRQSSGGVSRKNVCAFTRDRTP